ncbi:spermidine synthase [Agrobacterium sp. ES01]|uniref:spermidine synthase n=1 Tax=Agrobacterium sp. ES01 TaxID=3420714 RepID=UPI003D0E965D
MIPWTQIDSASIPGGGGELRLKQRGTEFSIMLGSNELMNSRLSGSEEALATLAFAEIEATRKPHMLIGGLGMGFTLRAALAVLPKDATVTVAELVPAVIAWARGPMAEVFKGCLDDPRVTIHEGDVAALIKASRDTFDAILLDVDNGPDGLTRESNDQLYSFSGLQYSKAALRKGGMLAVWSSGPDPRFTRRLKDSGYTVREVNTRANGKRGGARHVIWLAGNGTMKKL